MSPRLRLILSLAVGVVVLLLLVRLRDVLWPLVVALGIAYILDPVVCWIERRGARRSFAVAFLLALVAGVAVSVLLFVIPAVVGETSSFARKLPQYGMTIQARVEPWLAQLRDAHPQAYDTARQRAGDFLKEHAPGWISPVSGWLAGMFSNVLSLVLGVLDLAIIPVIAVYLLLDFPRLLAQIQTLIPLRLRPALVARVREIDQILGQFLRGQLTVCTILAVLYATGLTLLGVPLAILVGVGAGFLNLIPYFGFAVGVVSASVLSYVEYRSLGGVVAVLLLFVIVQVLEGTLIGPRIVGEQLGLHPVVVVMALLAAGELLGFLGVLIAVPAAAVLKVFVADLADRYRASAFFRQSA